MPHAGVVLRMDEWRALADRLEGRAVDFVVRPTVRFAGEPGERATMFLTDPSGNPIEIKGFADLADVFAT